jgi:putative ABC transport system permease protein
MLQIALKMLGEDRAKYLGLLLGISFTAFLVTFAASYFAGFMTRGFALIAENGGADVWVMDPAVNSVEQTVNMPDAALGRVRSVAGVRYATPLALATVDARLPNGRFQPFQVIGVDDATLIGAPVLRDGTSPAALHAPDAIIVDPGGTSGKLGTPAETADRWPPDSAHLAAPLRQLRPGDEFLINDHRVRVIAVSATLPRFPPRPLIYTTYSNALRILPQQRNRLTFVLVHVARGTAARDLAQRIERRTGLRARASADFRADTVHWYLINSEDVGDMAAMLALAMSVGFGVTGVLLYMFTYENLRQYAVLKAMGATGGVLLTMVLAQAGLCAALGTGLGVGLCGLVGQVVSRLGYPFRMMWFTPLAGGLGVLIASITAAAISVRPVLRLQPGVVFLGR